MAAAMVFGTLAMVPLALFPLAIGRAIDAAISGAAGALWTWVGVLLALGAVQAASVGLGEYVATTLWVGAATRTQRAVLTHAARLGATLPSRIRTGEIVAIGSSDVYAIGSAFEIIGRTTGAVMAFAVVAVVLLTGSPLLGTAVLVGVPLATAGVVPLLGPLRRRTEAHREQVGAATSMAADIVAGLRVLRGIGGERRFADRFAAVSQRVRHAGVAAGRIDAWLAGIEVLLPGLVTVVVTWLGARLALAGEISVGELVAYYGVTAFLVLPVGIAGEAAHNASEALVAAGRAAAVLALRPVLSSPPDPVPLPAGAFGLTDPSTRLHCPSGQLTVVHTDGPADTLADRLGRFVETSVLADSVPLAEADLTQVRRRIVVAHNADVLFSGPLADEVSLGDVEPERNGVALVPTDATQATPLPLATALWTADAADIVAGLPNGVYELLTERGRRLSGGQRQRLMLARALSADPDVLVLDEPTSAVDAHTEARIARRVAELRRDRTTVVITHSPLWTAAADHVTILETPR